MKQISILLWAFWLQCGWGQSISEIRISPQGDYLAFVQNADSLFLDRIPQQEEEKAILLGTGLKENFNQRFLKWSPNQKHVLWESHGQLFQFDLETQTTLRLDLNELRMGKYFRINQVAYSKDQLVYFSGGNPSGTEPFSLYEADFKTGSLTKLLTLEGDIANVDLSSDEELLAFTEYTYEHELYSSRVHLFNPESRMPLGSSTWYPNAFFHRLSFSTDGSLLCRNAWGKAYVFELPELEDHLEEVASPEPEGIYFLQFIDEELLCAQQGEEGIEYALRDRSGHFLKRILNIREGEKLHTETFPHLLVSFESGVKPKTLYGIKNSERIKRYTFRGNNPLATVPFETFSYDLGAGHNERAFVYGAGGKGVLLIPYGGYSNRYPQLNYFLNELAFSLLTQGYKLVFLNTRGYANQTLGRDYGKQQLADTELFLEQWKKLWEEFSRFFCWVIVMGLPWSITISLIRIASQEELRLMGQAIGKGRPNSKV